MMPQATQYASKRLFSVDEYHRLVEVGILTPNDKVELIQGEIIKMSPIGPKHAGNIDFVVQKLILLFQEEIIVRNQNPVQLGNMSEPEPDVSILKPNENYYTSSHPKAEDVLLLIEYSDSTLQYDQNTKIPLYAVHLIPEVWIVDLKQNRVITYSSPKGEEYLNIRTYQKGETIVTGQLTRPISVNDLLI
jgi:Uma2 family endonuclease